ncbi:Sugar fermentation stimulation protein SfsA [hydrothermal vent metagenome]|uniref:Sugar fermentation stimulation protein SfsA n=1 Tax=hydrothermal vent metagenome TaxID=652676 RepID=A0A3B1B887_9ZZZZ
MHYFPELIPAILIRRYKRFLADVRLETGEEITVHTPNTGRMLGLTGAGSPIWLKDSQNPKRKYRYSWVIATTDTGVAVGVDTLLANRLVVEGIQTGSIAELQGYVGLETEVRYGNENSRIDILLQNGDEACYVEVKNVTAMLEPGTAVFPDAVSERGRKHLRELMLMKQQGARAVMFFCVMREDAQSFCPADEIDPGYGLSLRQAAAAGVEILAYRARVSAVEMLLHTRLPVELSL